MVPGSSDLPDSFEDQLGEKDDLLFLREEGLALLALFKRIKDGEKRRLVVELIQMLADDHPKN